MGGNAVSVIEQRRYTCMYCKSKSKVNQMIGTSAIVALQFTVYWSPDEHGVYRKPSYSVCMESTSVSSLRSSTLYKYCMTYEVVLSQEGPAKKISCSSFYINFIPS